MIHSDSVTDVYSKEKVPLWLISAFKAGFLNTVGLLLTGKFVSHVTGFGTQVGLAIGHKDYLFGAELFIIPFSFIMGGVLTSAILDRHYEQHETPPYWKVQLLVTACLFLIVALDEFGHIGTGFPFDADNHYNSVEFLVIALLCLVCGLKNGLVTWSTFGRIRVTHLTGLSTDIGLNFLRTLNRRWPSPRFKDDRIVNVLRILTFASFSAGAFGSALIYAQIGIKSLIIPMLISVGMSIVAIYDGRRRDAQDAHKGQRTT